MCVCNHKANICRILINRQRDSPRQIQSGCSKYCKNIANATDVGSFLGLVNFCCQIIKDYAALPELLRQLTRKGDPFVWKGKQHKSFTKLQVCLKEASVMSYYQPKADSKVTVDESLVGLGAILVQRQKKWAI